MYVTKKVHCFNNPAYTHCSSCQKKCSDSKNHNFVSGPQRDDFNSNMSCRLIQSFKNKIKTLQNESRRLKKPQKQKHKDYYWLMLRKINTLDKKLQNLEDLLVTHLNHDSETTNNFVESVNNSNEYLVFYDSIRSLLDLARKLKEEMICKKYNILQKSNKSASKLYDKINILERELEHLSLIIENIIHPSTSHQKNGVKKNFFRKKFKIQNEELQDCQHIKNVNIELECPLNKDLNKFCHKYQNPKDRCFKDAPMSMSYERGVTGTFPFSSCCCQSCVYRNSLKEELCDGFYDGLDGLEKDFTYEETRQPHIGRASNCSCNMCSRSNRNIRKRYVDKIGCYIKNPSNNGSPCSCTNFSNKKYNRPTVVYNQHKNWAQLNCEKAQTGKIQVFNVAENRSSDCLHRVKKTLLRRGKNVKPFYKEVEVFCYKPSLKQNKFKMEQKKSLNYEPYKNISYFCYNNDSTESQHYSSERLRKSDRPPLNRDRRDRNEVKRQHKINSKAKEEFHTLTHRKNLEDGTVPIYYKPLPTKTNYDNNKRGIHRIINKVPTQVAEKYNTKIQTKGKHSSFYQDQLFVKCLNLKCSSNQNIRGYVKEENTNKYSHCESDSSLLSRSDYIPDFKIYKSKLFKSIEQNTNKINKSNEEKFIERRKYVLEKQTDMKNDLNNHFHGYSKTYTHGDKPVDEMRSMPKSIKSQSRERVYSSGSSELSLSDTDFFKPQFYINSGTEEELSVILSKSQDSSSSYENEDTKQIRPIDKLNDLESDLCDLCIVKEKRIQIHPRKPNKWNDKCENKIIIKKEIIRCPDCRYKLDNRIFGAGHCQQTHIYDDDDVFVKKAHKRKKERQKNKEITKLDIKNGRAKFSSKSNLKLETKIYENSTANEKRQGKYEREVPIFQTELEEGNLFQSLNVKGQAKPSMKSINRVNSSIKSSYNQESELHNTSYSNSHNIAINNSADLSHTNYISVQETKLNSLTKKNYSKPSNNEDLEEKRGGEVRNKISTQSVTANVKEFDEASVNKRPGSGKNISNMYVKLKTKINSPKRGNTRDSSKIENISNGQSEILNKTSLAVEIEEVQPTIANNLKLSRNLEHQNNMKPNKSQSKNPQAFSSSIKYPSEELENPPQILEQSTEQKKIPLNKSNLGIFNNKNNDLSKNNTTKPTSLFVEKQEVFSQPDIIKPEKKGFHFNDHQNSDRVLFTPGLYKKFNQYSNGTKRSKMFEHKANDDCEYSQTTSSKATSDTLADFYSKNNYHLDKPTALSVSKKTYKPTKSRFRYTNCPRTTTFNNCNSKSGEGTKYNLYEEPYSTLSETISKGSNYYNLRATTTSQSSFSVVNWEEVAKKLKEEESYH